MFEIQYRNANTDAQDALDSVRQGQSRKLVFANAQDQAVHLGRFALNQSERTTRDGARLHHDAGGDALGGCHILSGFQVDFLGTTEEEGATRRFADVLYAGNDFLPRVATLAEAHAADKFQIDALRDEQFARVFEDPRISRRYGCEPVICRRLCVKRLQGGFGDDAHTAALRQSRADARLDGGVELFPNDGIAESFGKLPHQTDDAGIVQKFDGHFAAQDEHLESFQKSGSLFGRNNGVNRVVIGPQTHRCNESAFGRAITRRHQGAGELGYVIGDLSLKECDAIVTGKAKDAQFGNGTNYGSGCTIAHGITRKISQVWVLWRTGLKFVYDRGAYVEDNNEKLKQNTDRDDFAVPKQRCFRLLGKVSVVLAVASAAVVGLGLAAYLRCPIPLPEDVAHVDVVIPKGASARRVVELTRQAGVNLPSFVLLSAMKFEGASQSIHVGRYRFERGMSLHEVIGKFRDADVQEGTVTVADGMTEWQLRAMLAEHPDLQADTKALSAQELLRSIGSSHTHLEGLFAPDTYHFKSGVSDLSVLKTAYKRQMQLLEAAWQTRPGDSLLKTPYQALILASIIEKETSKSADRILVSSVFHNRLRVRMPLQTDPTVIYGLGASFDGNLRKRDLKEPGIYNTYVNYGLPPTPISMPTKASIEAALHPARTEFLYFVARGDGTTQFSKTLEEHNRAVNRYQKGK